jgi:aspartokinase/homoserine dehydrogenase 1
MKDQAQMSSERVEGQFAKHTEPFVEHFQPHRAKHGYRHRTVRRPLTVMKFGGTSLGDAACIRKVVEIICSVAAESEAVVVVSAMGGVTNRLIEAATQSAAGDCGLATAILKDLRQQHDIAVRALIHSEGERNRIAAKMNELFAEGERCCERTALFGELTPQLRDSISSLGERLSAPLVAAAMAARGAACEAIEATELVVTDAFHGGADPKMDLTRVRCEARLRPLLERGIIPIVTGFIGATEAGVLTTLGRGGSDYSATILGAALEADEVTIWTDVDGMLTADPHLVPGASTIPEITYREAAELAHFGAKVLHPKTLRPVMRCGIPVFIRNTFAPEKPGTKITSTAHAGNGGVKALTAVSDAALITVGGLALSNGCDVVGRTLATVAAVRAYVLMISHSLLRNHVCLVVAAACAERTVEALRREFASDLQRGNMDHVTVDSTVAILTVVGQKPDLVKEIVRRALDELSRENVNIIAAEQSSSECKASFVVARKDLKTALVATHREFEPCTVNLPQDSRSEAQLL